MKIKKILLLHGWNWKNYTKFCSENTSPWHNRAVFVEELRKNGYELMMPAFPGFCGTKDPENSWSLDDFSYFVESYFVSEKPDAVLGYSFGGAVATNWRELCQRQSVPLILISPALARQYVVKKSKLSLILSKLLPVRFSFLRNLYLTWIVKNPFHIHGTRFLRKTYQNIVKVNLLEILEKTIDNNMLLVYGAKDTATPPSLVEEKFPPNSLVRSQTVIIDNGDHDIANSHPGELVRNIQSFLKKQESENNN